LSTINSLSIKSIDNRYWHLSVLAIINRLIVDKSANLHRLHTAYTPPRIILNFYPSYF
jgi:hypothetical protein